MTPPGEGRTPPMKLKLIKRLSTWMLTRLPWRLFKAVVIEALNNLPPIRRELVLRAIVAQQTGGAGHLHGNPTRRGR